MSRFLGSLYSGHLVYLAPVGVVLLLVCIVRQGPDDNLRVEAKKSKNSEMARGRVASGVRLRLAFRGEMTPLCIRRVHEHVAEQICTKTLIVISPPASNLLSPVPLWNNLVRCLVESMRETSTKRIGFANYPKSAVLHTQT
jgi:hypothetical protein